MTGDKCGTLFYLQSMIRFLLIGFIFLIGESAALAAPLQVQSVQLEVESNSAEVLKISLSEPVTHRAFLLPAPPRVVIDLPPFQWRVDDAALKQYRGKLIQNIRYARFDSQTSRIVLDLQQPITLTPIGTTAENQTPMSRMAFRLESLGHHQSAMTPLVEGGLIPQDMTLELAKREATTPPPLSEPSEARMATPSPASALPPSLPATPSIPNAQSAKNIFSKSIPIPQMKPSQGFSAAADNELQPKAILPLIVIDAGHGGQDSGTIGRSQTKEKNVTLAYAHALRDALVATGRYRASLTRSDDRFIMLRDRFRMARAQKAALFISLHADSAPTDQARGLSIYTLSEEASDAEAEALAAQENKVDVLAGVDLGTQDADVADILIDLAQRETKNKSIILADDIVDAMRGRVDLLKNTHRYAGFAVLKAPDIPSALIEIGFLSHPEEEKKIITRTHRAAVIRGIVTGMDRYFARR
jgi:N-acetylmuramoyl-L-alanine amidase